VQGCRSAEEIALPEAYTYDPDLLATFGDLMQFT
jgi:hypothetical protein